MATILVVDDDPGIIALFFRLLGEHKHKVLSASTARDAMHTLKSDHPDLVVCDVLLPDATGLDILRSSRTIGLLTPFLMLSGGGNVRYATEAMKLGAIDFLEKPVEIGVLMARIDSSLHLDRPEAHAAARWARTIALVLHAPRDPKTLALWSQMVYASPGALRNWCRTAGVTARRSLILARLLRAATLSENGRHRAENLLDVVDLRTLRSLFKAVGLHHRDEFRITATELLNRQTIVTDPDTLNELRKAVANSDAERASHGLTDTVEW